MSEESVGVRIVGSEDRGREKRERVKTVERELVCEGRKCGR